MIEEIVDFMSRKGISIAVVQETKLNNSLDVLSCAGFSVIREAPERDNGSGLAFILHSMVQYRLIDRDIDCRDTTPECQGMAIRSGDAEPEIFNTYTSYMLQHHPIIGALLRDKNRGGLTRTTIFGIQSLTNNSMGIELRNR